MPDPQPARAEAYLAPETLAQLAPFELRAKMIVEGVTSGMHRSPYQGMAVEFAQHRQYVPGDDLKHLDWKVFGRSDKLTIKQYQQETNLDVVLLVDASGSMGYGTLNVKSGWGGTAASRRNAQWTKFDHATALATAMSFVCLNQQDRVGVVVFAQGIRRIVKRSNGRGQWRLILNALSGEPVEEATDLTRTAEQTLSRITNRALFVIVSDFFAGTDEVRSALARFRHGRHDVICLQVLDREEMRFSFTNEAPFEGLEDEGRVRIDPRALRTSYLEALGAHIQSIEQAAKGFGFDHQVIDSHESVGPALSCLLEKRNAWIARSKVG